MSIGSKIALAVLVAAWGCAAQNTTSAPTDAILAYKEFKLDFAGGITLGILIAVVCLILGLFYLLVGARYPKASVSSITFLFLTGGLFFVLNFFNIAAYICLIVGAIVGLASIVLTLKVWKVGLFVLGGGAGFVIWLVVKALAADKFTTNVIIYASMAAVILVFALLAIKFEKQSFITATSLIGSFFLVQGVDSLIPGHASVFSLISDTSGLVCAYDTEWCTGIYISIFAIAIVGMIIQFKVTAKFYKKRRGVKNKSDYRRKRRGKRPYAKDEEEEKPRDRRRYRNKDNGAADEDRDRDEDRKSERRSERNRERKGSDDAPIAPSGNKTKLQEENAELKVRLSDMDRKLQDAQTKLDEAWDLTQEEKDLVTRFRVDKRENARIAKEAAAREKARQKEEQEARDAEERDRRKQEEEDERNAKKARKADKQRDREREKEAERQRQEEEDAYAAKKSRKKTKDEPPPYKEDEAKKKSSKKGGGKKKSSEKKRRDSTPSASENDDSAEG